MNRILLRLAWAGIPAILSSQLPVNAQIPRVVRTRLSNGVRLVMVPYSRTPMLSTTAIFPSTGKEPAAKAGLAELTATLMRKGAGDRNAQQIAEEIEFLGGSLSTSAGGDAFTVSLSVLKKDFKAGLGIFSDTIRRPKFDQEELDRERKLGLAALESLAEDPGALADRVMNRVVFGNHPYGNTETAASLTSVTREDVVSLYRDVISPLRMTLVVVGDFVPTELTAEVEKLFGDWKAEASERALPPRVPAMARKVVLIDKPDATQAQVRWVRPAFDRKSADYYPALIASTILGGGFTSRLTQEIRVNQSLTYGINSRFRPRLLGGALVVSTFTKLDTTRKIIDETQKVLQAIVKRGVTEAEMTKARRYLSGLFAIGSQSPEDIAGRLVEAETYGLSEDYPANHIRHIGQVTLNQVNKIISKYMQIDSFSLIVLAPSKVGSKALTGLGSLETLTLDQAIK